MKRNNLPTILLIGFLGLLAIVLIVFMSIWIVQGKNYFFHFAKTNMEILEEKEFDYHLVNSISINVKSADIHVVESNTNQIKVKISGNKDEQYDIDLNHEVLSINKKGGNYFCFGFCYIDYEIEISVPKDYSKKMKIETISGDVSIDANLNADLSISTTSGDIETKDIQNATVKSTSGDITVEKALDLNISSTSGDIEIDRCNNINIVTTSGEISINSIDITRNSKIETISGDVEIDRTNDIYIDTKTTSGEVSIKNNNRHSDYELSITTTSGDIDVE